MTPHSGSEMPDPHTPRKPDRSADGISGPSRTKDTRDWWFRNARSSPPPSAAAMCRPARDPLTGAPSIALHVVPRAQAASCGESEQGSGSFRMRCATLWYAKCAGCVALSRMRSTLHGLQAPQSAEGRAESGCWNVAASDPRWLRTARRRYRGIGIAIAPASLRRPPSSFTNDGRALADHRRRRVANPRRRRWTVSALRPASDTRWGPDKPRPGMGVAARCRGNEWWDVANWWGGCIHCWNPAITDGIREHSGLDGGLASVGSASMRRDRRSGRGRGTGDGQALEP